MRRITIILTHLVIFIKIKQVLTNDKQFPLRIAAMLVNC